MKKNKGLWPFFPIMALLVLSNAIMTVLSFVFSKNLTVAYIQTAVTVILAVATMIRIVTAQKGMLKFINRTASQFSSRSSAVLQNIVMPTLIVRHNGEIIWYNELFKQQIAEDEMYGADISRIFNDNQFASFEKKNTAEFSANGREYTVYSAVYPDRGNDFKTVFSFAENTKLKAIKKEYYLSRPVAVLVAIDSYSDITANVPESELASMRGAVEREIEDFAKSVDSFVRRLSNQCYILILEERNIKEVIQDKFSILDRVRAMTFNGEKGNITLSIGVGRGGKNVKECEASARQSLDMAQGRGGDQAVLKTEDGYEFFGGVSKGVEKRTKVKTRFVASAIKDLILASENVLIMGHKFADLDALGAACALRKICISLGVRANIVLDREQNLAKQLMQRIDTSEEEEAIILPEDAESLINEKTLLMIVDTHRAAFVESPEIYNLVKNVVVIDHHRRTADHINDAVVFYHEPLSSSTCEMISELVQYMGEKLLGRSEAEALLAGIMLDTKNFILRTGVRTFEASAYLRSLGADPVEVKKMFAGSINEYKEKSELVSSAKIYSNCAVSGGRPEGSVSRIAAAQAADELLNIEGVDASFVMFMTGNTVNISARSLGAVNVQLVMEQLGGGGHMTMAAAQLQGVSYEEALKKLVAAIDKIRKD